MKEKIEKAVESGRKAVNAIPDRKGDRITYGEESATISL